MPLVEVLEATPHGPGQGLRVALLTERLVADDLPHGLLVRLRELKVVEGLVVGLEELDDLGEVGLEALSSLGT